MDCELDDGQKEHNDNTKKHGNSSRPLANDHSLAQSVHRMLRVESFRLMDGHWGEWINEWGWGHWVVPGDHLYHSTMGGCFELNSMDTEYLNLPCWRVDARDCEWVADLQEIKSYLRNFGPFIWLLLQITGPDANQSFWRLLFELFISQNRSDGTKG